MASRRAVVGAVLLTVTALVATGCADIPERGPVRAVSKRVPATNAYSQQDIRLLPPAPEPGATPRDIVEGFYLAMSDFSDGSYAAARDYLAPSIRESWRPHAATTTIYDRHDVSPVSGAPDRFVVRLNQVAQIGADNDYVRASGVRLDTVELGRVDGEWRITIPPAGLAIPLVNAQRVLGAVDVYFVGAVDHLLVPDRVMLPVTGTALPRELVDQLVGGPTAWLAGAVHPVAPVGTVVRSVTVQPDGTATVDLGGAATRLSGTALTDLEAALALTLDQLHGNVLRTRLLFDGRQVAPPFAADQFASYTGVVVATPAYFVDSGRLRLLSEADPPTQLAVPRIPGMQAPAVAATKVAALVHDDNGTTLVTSSIGSTSAPVVSRLDAWRLTRPTWSPGGEAVWTVASDTKGRQQLWRIGAEGGPARVRLGLRTEVHGVSAFEISRDGARVALVGRGSDGTLGVFVGRIVPVGDGFAVEGLRSISPDAIGTPIDLSWSSPDAVAVLAREADGSTAAYALDIDGSGNRPVGVTVVSPRASRIAAAPGRPWLVSATDGAIYEQQGVSWHRVHSGRDPLYPV